MASIVDNIERENYIQHAPETLDMGLRILDATEDPDVRKSLYALFAALSNVMKEDIMPALPKIIERMLETIQSSEGIVVSKMSYFKYLHFNA